MNKIILARYMESVDWVVAIPNDFQVTIYNKGDPITSPEVNRRAQIVQRPNHGRESETYLYHMMTEVEDNDDFTVYSQADPFTHSPDFLRLLANWRQWDELQPLSWQWKNEHEVPPSFILQDYERKLKGRLRFRPERFSLHTWAPVEFHDSGALTTGSTYRLLHNDLREGGNVAAHFLSIAKLPQIAREAEAHSLGVFSYGALFAARNYLVKQLPLESAKMLYQATMGHPCYGYILERMWLHFFGADFLLPLSAPIELEDVTEAAEPTYAFASR